MIIPAHNAEKCLRRAVESVLSAMDIVAADAVIASHLKGGDPKPAENEPKDRKPAENEPKDPKSAENLPKDPEPAENAAGHPDHTENENAGEIGAFPRSAAPLFEILIIENGSDDATEFVGRSLQAEYKGIVRLLKSERGVSNARNRGLQEAAGEWILFLDADDYFIEGAGTMLRDALHFTGTDFIVCSFEAGSRRVHVCPPEGERFSGKQMQEICVRMIEDPTRYTSVWSKFFRRENIERLQLRFDPSLRLSEDSHFVIRYLAGCRRLRLIDRPFYHYSTDGASAVRTWDGSKEEGYKKSLAAVQAFLKTQPHEIRRAGAGYGMMQFNLLMVREVFSVSNPLSMGEKISEMKRIAGEEPFASAIGAYDPAHHSGARYLPLRLLTRGPASAAAAVYVARVLQNAFHERRN